MMPLNLATPALAEPSTPETITKNRTYRLRKVIKENHRSAIVRVAFHLEDADAANLVATVGGDHLCVYDNEHEGSHLDPMSVLDAKSSKDARSVTPKRIRAFAWVKQPLNNVSIVLGCEDATLHVVDFARLKVTNLLRGHRGAIRDVQSIRARSIVLSSSDDLSVRMWDIKMTTSMCIFSVDCSALAVHHDSGRFVTASPVGTIREWPTSPSSSSSSASSTSRIVRDEACLSVVGTSFPDTDCIAYCGENMLLKMPRKVVMIDARDGTVIWSRALFNLANPGMSRFGVSEDHRFMSLGNLSGSVFVIETETGNVLQHLQNKKSKNRICDCAFSLNSKSIIAVDSRSYMFRWDLPRRRRLQAEATAGTTTTAAAARV